MKMRCCLTIIRSVLLLGAMSLLVGGTAAVPTQASNDKKAEEDSMLPAHTIQSPVIPPIDADVPANFQTASFGLG